MSSQCISQIEHIEWMAGGLYLGTSMARVMAV
jgi:hypothetical protein